MQLVYNIGMIFLLYFFNAWDHPALNTYKKNHTFRKQYQNGIDPEPYWIVTI